MATNYGFSGLKNNQSNTKPSEIFSQLSTLSEKIIGVRVLDIILDDTHPKFQKYGEWNGIGTIEFEKTDEPNQTNTNNNAIPLLPHLANYPLVNEIVLVFSLPNRTQSKNLNKPVQYYYLNPVNIWNHPHHNALPNPLLSVEESTTQEDVDYQQMEKGVSRKNDSKPFNLNLNPPSGGNFVERSNIHPILPFMGDNIFEGRFGNSIRLGNTSKTKSLYNNNWSNTGENGDPITILRNGQPKNTSETGFEPIVENINDDLSSIYLTSTQQIPLKTDFPDFPALKKNPESLSEYSKNQIILSSGRLTFNSRGDSIFLSSNKSISLNASEDIALFSRNSNITLQGKEVKLGEKRASESIILGDKFMEGFEQLLFGISLLCDSLTIEPLLGPSSATAGNLKLMAENMKSQLNQYLSKTVKSI